MKRNFHLYLAFARKIILIFGMFGKENVIDATEEIAIHNSF